MKTLNILFCIPVLFLFPLCAQSGLDEIFAPYNPGTLSDAQIEVISEAIRSAGFRGGPELDQMIRDEGFDPELFKGEPPSPQEENGRVSGSETNRQGPEETGGGHEQEHRGSGKIYSSLSGGCSSPGFALSSSAVQGGELLSGFKCEKKMNGKENSIPLSWENVPDGTGSLAIVMYHYPNPDDKGSVNSYLLLWNIPPDVQEIPYGAADDGPWYIGQNKDGNTLSYSSPCSPSAGVHEYVISLFALKEVPESLPGESSMEVDFDAFMTAVEESDILGRADLVFLDVNA